MIIIVIYNFQSRVILLHSYILSNKQEFTIEIKSNNQYAINIASEFETNNLHVKYL